MNFSSKIIRDAFRNASVLSLSYVGERALLSISRRMHFPFISRRIKQLHNSRLACHADTRLFAFNRESVGNENSTELWFRSYDCITGGHVRERERGISQKTWEREREPVSPDGGARTRLAEILRKPRAGWVLRAPTRSLVLALCKW